MLEREFRFFHAGIQNRSLLRKNTTRFRNRNNQQRVKTGASFQAIVPAAKFGERANAEFREPFANLFGE